MVGFLIFVVFLCYVALVIQLIRGTLKTFPGQTYPLPLEAPDQVSVIIAARNEQDDIDFLLRDLRENNHPNFEVIVIDDESSDDTSSIVHRLSVTDPRFRVIRNEGAGKKAAITTGIGVSTGSIILMTDADCRVGPKWISGMHGCFESDSTQMVLGPVRMSARSVIDVMQSIEFSSLVGSAAALAGLGTPVLANGANLAFRRQAFEAVEGYKGNEHVPSGDDEFLLRKIKAKYADGVKFATNSQTVVSTAPNYSLREFIHQRIRWAGKWRQHNDRRSQVLAVFIAVFQLTVLATPFLVLGNVIAFSTFLYCMGMKVIVDFAFLRVVNRYIPGPWRYTAFFLLQLVYPVYVVSAGVLANFRSYEWKGRRVKTVVVNG